MSIAQEKDSIVKNTNNACVLKQIIGTDQNAYQNNNVVVEKNGMRNLSDATVLMDLTLTETNASFVLLVKFGIKRRKNVFVLLIPNGRTNSAR